MPRSFSATYFVVSMLKVRAWRVGVAYTQALFVLFEEALAFVLLGCASEEFWFCVRCGTVVTRDAVVFATVLVLEIQGFIGDSVVEEMYTRGLTFAVPLQEAGVVSPVEVSERSVVLNEVY